MRVAIIGRTGPLLDAARRLRAEGHAVPVVITSAAEPFYSAHESDFEAFAREAGAQYLFDPPVNAEQTIAAMRRHECDLALSINWRTLIGAGAIRAFRLGVINCHTGDLPRYRGNACANWAILNGEDHVGLCLHWMDSASVDAGPVLARRRLPLTPDVYIGDVHAWVEQSVPAMAVDVIRRLADGSLAAIPQDADARRPLRCFPRRPEDGRIDWTRSASDIHRLVRASSRPFAGAFAFAGNRRATVWRAAPHAMDTEWLAVPGQVMAVVDGAPVVACGSGALRLTEVEIESGGRLTGAHQRLTPEPLA